MKTLNFKIALSLGLFFLLTSVYAQNKPDALKMYNSGQYKNAIEVCLSEIKDAPNNLDSYVVLTWALVADGQYIEALNWAEKSKSISKFDPRILETEGQAYYHLGQNGEAIRCFETYVVYAPNGNRHSLVYYFLGEIYLRLKKFSHADIAFSTAVRLEPNNAVWWSRLGYAREMSNEPSYALHAYQRALDLNKNLVEAQDGRSRILSRM